MRISGISIYPRRSEPLHTQIFDQVATRIRSGAFPAGHRLPPSRALALEIGAHRNTVVRAYEDLEAAGLVRSTVGRGTFVEPAAPAAPAAGAAEGAGMPWASLLSRVASAEPLGRLDRIGRTPAKGDAVNLSRMQPSEDLLPHELLRRCVDHVLRDQKGAALGYAPPEGLPRLRAVIAEDLARQGVPARADDLLITTGSQQALDLVARALINPGDAFLVDTTTYTGALNLLSAAGARLVPMPADAEGPDLEALHRLSRSGAKGFYLMPSCHNPTGACVSTARREALVAWARDAGVPLIEDDYGADLGLEGQPPPPPLRAFDGDVLYTGTFSKKLAPALRVGFLVCPPALRPAMVALKHAMDLGTSALLQHTLAEFLERGYMRAHLGKTLPEYRSRRDALLGSLREHLPASVHFHRPDRGVVLWLELPAGLDAERVYEEAKREGVIVSPGTLNAVDARPQRGLRLTFCAERTARVVEGGRRLGKAVRALIAGQRTGKTGAPALEIV